jgi:hypothetical protein
MCKEAVELTNLVASCQQAGNKQCGHILLTSCWNSIVGTTCAFLCVYCGNYSGWACIWSLVILTKISWGGKNRRALLTGNVIKQLQEIRLNEDLLSKI